MKKLPLIIATAMSMFVIGQAKANVPIVDEANAVRSYAYHLNHEAAELEATVRYSLKHGHNPVHLRKEAADLRRAATSLAWESNRLAKAYYNGHYY